MKHAIHTCLAVLAFALFVHPAPAQQAVQPAVRPIAPKIHVLIVGNTLADGIGKGVTNNIIRLEGIIGNFGVARLRAQVNKIAGANFSCAALDAALAQLNRPRVIGANDTVIFYFAGHGFRDEQMTSPFPKLVCGELPSEAREFEPIVRRLKKSARLVIGITDSCNVVLPIISRPFAAAQLPPLDDRGRRIRHLLLDYRGTLMMSATKPNQFAYYAATTFSPIEMGHFSRQLLNALSGAIDRNDPDAEWEQIVEAGIRKINIRNDAGTVVDTQQPQALNELTRIRATVTAR